MAQTMRIVFVPYTWRTKGKTRYLEQGAALPCRSESDALNRLEKIRAGVMTAAGGRAFKMLVDEAVGDYGDPELLGEVGEVPSLEEA